VSAHLNNDLRAKIEFLSRPEHHEGAPLAVEVVETHFAWVFLAGRLAYKLKKPLHFRDFDWTTLAARRANCELEVALNRRLAPAVYIGAVPVASEGGKLSLAGPGSPVEWLVKMHRLPRDRALDRLAAAGQVEDSQLRALLVKLAGFYATAARAPWDGRAYRRMLAGEIARTAAELSAPAFGLDMDWVRALAAELAHRLETDARALHQRVADGRVVDAHGDLRPEHVFMQQEPQVIDCLEFSSELRLLDSAAEIAFLTLECNRLSYPKVAKAIVEHYRDCARDECDLSLLEFYGALRAFVRAKVAAWHLEDGVTADEQALWRARAYWYLDAAAAGLGIERRTAEKSRR
jgi:aminoglycoside phosphotransferase family enzyme